MPPQDDQPLRGAADALAAYFVGDATVAEALDRICEAAVRALPAASLAGISMTIDARIGTYVFTHPEVEEIDRAQYATGDGPCVEAFGTGRPVIIASTVRPGPFPNFRGVAAEHGYLSVISMPMDTGSHVVGALNLYGRAADAFTQESVAQLRGFATQAAFLLLNHQAYWDARSLSENLQQALQSRAEIEQAKGIIMGSTGCTAEAAFGQLRAQSQRENVKLRDIAAELVHRAQRDRPS